MNLRYLEEKKHPFDDYAVRMRLPGNSVIVRNTLKPIIPSSSAPRTGSSMQTGYIVLCRPTLESLLTKTCKKGHNMTRIWTSFAIYLCITRNSTKNKIIVQLQLLDANIDVVTAYGAMDIFHLKEYFLSLARDSGRTSPVYSRHSCNECYIGSDILFTALRHLKSYLSTTTLQERLNHLICCCAFTRIERRPYC